MTGPGQPYRPAGAAGAGGGTNRSESRAAARRSISNTPAPLRRSKTEDISDNGDESSILRQFIIEIQSETESINAILNVILEDFRCI